MSLALSPAEAVGVTSEQALQTYVGDVNRDPGEYLYTRAQLAAAVERGSLAADPSVFAGNGLARKIAEREAMGIPVFR